MQSLKGDFAVARVYMCGLRAFSREEESEVTCPGCIYIRKGSD
jgi:hypothetical protein